MAAFVAELIHAFPAAMNLNAVDPEKVILFGSHATSRWAEHRYTEGGTYHHYGKMQGQAGKGVL